jgi:hypothetical protein
MLDLHPIRLIVYPNPTSSLVTILVEGEQFETLTITDIYGNKIYENKQKLNHYLIHTDNWSNGNYILQYGAKRLKLLVSH